MDESERAELAAMVEHATRPDGGMSAAELSRRSGVSENTIASIKAGKRPYNSTAAKLRRAMGEPPAVESALQAPDTVKFAQDLVVMWLMGMPAAERAMAVRRLVEYIASETSGGLAGGPQVRHMAGQSGSYGRSD